MLLLRAPIARRTRLAADLAGSHGSAGVAATAETDFDILVKGASIATMRFAAAAGTATFIAAAETVLEPGRCAEHGGTGDSLCGPRRYRPCNRAKPGGVSRALPTDVQDMVDDISLDDVRVGTRPPVADTAQKNCCAESGSDIVAGIARTAPADDLGVTPSGSVGDRKRSGKPSLDPMPLAADGM